MRVLVTGGAGFVGSHVVERLCREGHDVRVLDNFSTGRASNLIEVQGEAEVLTGDVRDLEQVRRAVAGCELVVHQAALPSVRHSLRAPLETHAVNASGTLNVLVAAHDAGTRRVVFASSSSVYGESPELPQHEDLPCAPLSPYGVSKLAGEAYCRAFACVYGLETVSLRYFNVFGPRQRRGPAYASAFQAFVEALLEGKQAPVHGDGLQSRDFTYVENAVEANVLALASPSSDGSVYNVAGGESVTVLELLGELERLTGRSAAPLHGPARPGDPRHSQADLRLAREELGYEPIVDFREGLSRTVDYYARELPGVKLRSLAPPGSS